MTVKRMLIEPVTGAEAVAQVLVDGGVETVFGIPGGHASRIFDALEKHRGRLRTIVVREESLGSVMAEIQGRLTRRPGVLLGQGTWILGNGIIGTLEALLSSSPMLLLGDFTDNVAFAAHVPYQSGAGDYGSWDARRAFGGISKQVFSALDPVPAAHMTQLALKHAVSGQPGPVTVLYSGRALSGKIDPGGRPRIYPTKYFLAPVPPAAEPERVAQAAQALFAAGRPVVIAGNGTRISGAYEALRELAELAGLPVATTPSGKGCFAETHPLAVGPIGAHGAAAASACVGEADVVLVVGSKLGSYDTANENPALLDPERQTLIQIEVEPKNAAWTFPAEHTLIGDAARVLQQLLEHARSLPDGAARRSAGEARVAAHRTKCGYFDSPGYRADSLPMHPQRAIGELMRNLPSDAIVTLDAGENRIFMMHLYQTREARTYLQAAGAGPMGFAVPAALGAKLLNPARTVVAVAGDGGFSMTMNGLMTSIEHDIPIIAVVLNNRALGWVKHGPSEFADFRDFDFAAIGRAMGCRGVRVENGESLGTALREAIASGRTTVIDAVVSVDAMTYKDVTSALMAAAPAPAPAPAPGASSTAAAPAAAGR